MTFSRRHKNTEQSHVLRNTRDKRVTFLMFLFIKHYTELHVKWVMNKPLLLQNITKHLLLLWLSRLNLQPGGPPLQKVRQTKFSPNMSRKLIRSELIFTGNWWHKNTTVTTSVRVVIHLHNNTNHNLTYHSYNTTKSTTVTQLCSLIRQQCVHDNDLRS